MPQRLVKGSLVLGQVSAINDLDIALALPNNLVGHVSLTAVSEGLTARLQAHASQENEDNADSDNEDDGSDVDLHSLFELGQYLRAYVVSTSDDSPATTPVRAKHRIELSLQPEHANAGLLAQDVVANCTVMASVVSVEDHGFVMDLGISKPIVQGFLPKKKLDSSISQERMQPGAVMLCTVTSKGANGKIAQLTTLKSEVTSTKKWPSEATTIGTFLPGTVADVLVSEATQRGIIGKVLGHLDVTADLVHSGAGPDGTDLEEKFPVGSRFKARIICTFPAAKNPKLGFSILSHVLSMTSKTTKKDGKPAPPLTVLPSSSRIETCTVRKVESDIGLYVDVGVDGVPAFVHISRVKDGKVDALFENSGPFKVGSTHPGRVLGYNAFDGMFMISLEKSVLEQPYLRIEDVPIGEVVNGVIEKIVVNQDGLGGVVVKIAEGISGLVPETHLADVHLQHPEKKFREGMKVKARVLSTDPSKHQLRLTLKKTLVNSEAPPIKSFDELSVGLQTPGTIIKVLQKGAIVQFYGRLRGFLPVSEMSEAYIHDPKDHFRVGQVVSVNVLNFDPERSHLVVSCKDPNAFGLEKQMALKELKLGDVVSGKVTQKTEDDIFIELSNGSLNAMLNVGHLTDKSVSKNQSAWKRIRVGQTLNDLVVIFKNEGRRSITLSQKPSLVKAAQEGKLLTSIDDAKEGSIVQGYVRFISMTAAFVRFAGPLQALLPKSLMPRESQDKEGFGLHMCQSLEVKIVSVDRDQGRVVVAIPSSEDEEPKPDKSTLVVNNALDESITSIEDITIGKVTKARVVSVKDTQLNVQLADNIQGRVDVSQVYDSWNEIPNPKEPLQQFRAKQIIRVCVLGVHDARKHRFLPISHRTTHSVLELSAKPSDLKDDTLSPPLAFNKLEVGSHHLCFVNNVGSGCLWVNLSPNVRGRIRSMEASDDVSQLQDLEANFPIGSAIRARVTSIDLENKRLDLSARSPGSESSLTWDSIEPNAVLTGRVTKINDRQLMIKLSEALAGPIHLVDLADDYDEANPLKYSKNEIVRVSVVEVDKPNKRIRLSTRPSRVLNSSLPVKDREITKSSKTEVGDIIRGFVKNVSDKGVFVNLGGDVTAFVMIRDLSDRFLKDWKNEFQVDQVVKGRIISMADGRIGLSLKASVVEKDFKPLLTIADLKEGQVVPGKVRKVEEFGAFIDIDGSANVAGLCHRSEMAEKPVRDARKLYKEGDVVKARILKVDMKNKKINLGLKPSYFEDDDDEDSDMDVDEEAGGVALESDEEDSDGDEVMGGTGGAVLITGTDNDEIASDESDAESDVDMADAAPSGLSGLGSGGFDWSASALDAEESTGDGPSAAAEGLATTKRKRRGSQIQEDKTASLDAHGPQTASDYERVLLGQPDNWQLWIAYMAFQMQVSELAKAREVAERALKIINMREVDAKLNVWIAYLNLEVAYGTEETVEGVFKRACTYNDEQVVREKLASIYIRSGKHNVCQIPDLLFVSSFY